MTLPELEIQDPSSVIQPVASRYTDRATVAVSSYIIWKIF
jgi:hypothetical protein